MENGEKHEVARRSEIEHDPFYCVQDPDKGAWYVALNSLPEYIRTAIMDKTKGSDVPEDWLDLRQPTWAVHMLQMQAAGGSEKAESSDEDSVGALVLMPEGWNEFVWEQYDLAGRPTN